MTLEQGGQPQRMIDLARTTGLHKATTQRLLGVLERRGLVEREGGRYRVGLAAVPLANAFFLQNDITKAALPVLQELAVSTEETVTMYVRLGFSRVVVQRIEGRHPLRFVLPIGHRLPLHIGSGKVLAALMPPEELRQMLDQVGEIRRVTGEAWPLEAYLSELELVRKQGFCVSINERTLGAASVAAPILRADGTAMAAIDVVGPPESVTTDRIPALSVEVRRAAQMISQMYPSL